MTSALDRACARWGYAAAHAGNGETPTPPTSRLRDCGPGQDLNAMVTASGAIPAGSSCVSSFLLQTPRWPRLGEPGYKRPNPAADAQAFLRAVREEADAIAEAYVFKPISAPTLQDYATFIPRPTLPLGPEQRKTVEDTVKAFLGSDDNRFGPGPVAS